MKHKNINPEERNQGSSAERRIIESKVEVRMAEAKEGEKNLPPVLYGYALKFNKRTNIGWYDEIILTGALDGVIVRSDCKALLNHDNNFVMARSKYGAGTLSLTVDNVGLYFEFTPPETRADVIEMVQRGDIDQCSFKFITNEINWVQKEGEQELREIVSFDVIKDISLVADPAYIDTSVAMRCREEWRSKHPEEGNENNDEGNITSEQRTKDLYLISRRIKNIDNRIKTVV